MNKLFVSGCISVLLAVSVQSATYYVDGVSGSDTNNGTSSGTPWQHSPGDSLSTSNAAAATLAAGDKVIFKGGVAYTNEIDLNWSGTVGNPITYDGNSSGGWGTGKALFNRNHFGKYGFYGDTRSNILFKNWEITQIGGHGTNVWSCGDATDYNGWGIAIYKPDHITVQDSYFHDIGDWQNATNMNESHMNGIGVLFNDSAYSCIVSNCEFTQIGMAGIRVQAQLGTKVCTNMLITACSFHDYIRWGVDIASAAVGAKMSDIIIDGCTFYNFYQYDSTTWLGCAGSWPHTDPIIMRLANNPPVASQILGTTSQPNIVRNCLWYNNSPAQYGAGTAGIFLTTWGGRTLIYNNVFLNVLMHGEGAIYAQDGIDPTASPNALPDYWIMNNSFYGDTYCYVGRTLTAPLTSFALTNGTIRVLNNILYKTDSGAALQITTGLDAYSTLTQLDYNRYYTPNRLDSDVAYILSGGTGTYVDFPTLQAAGFEPHGSYGDPAYTDSTHGLGLNSSLNVLTLKITSPCRNVATNLTAFFTTDKLGVTRSTLWDLGAYAFMIPSGPAQLTLGNAVLGGTVSFK